PALGPEVSQTYETVAATIIQFPGSPNRFNDQKRSTAKTNSRAQRNVIAAGSVWWAASLRLAVRVPAERPEEVLAPHEKTPVRDGRCGHDVVVQRVHREQFEFGARLHDPDLPLLGSQVEAPVRGDRRGRVAVAAAADAFLVDFLARRGLVACEDARVGAGVEVLPVENRGGHVRP